MTERRILTSINANRVTLSHKESKVLLVINTVYKKKYECEI